MNSMPSDNSAEVLRSRLIKRSLALFANFFLIILAYYQVKAASRSLLIEFGGSAWFPYAWVYSAVVLTALIGFVVRRIWPAATIQGGSLETM